MDKIKVTARSRQAALIPTVAYGNLTLESTVELEDWASPDFYEIRLKELQTEANKRVLESLKEQREAIDNELDKQFYKV